jgi:CarD family transcriptional regulator
VLKLAVGDVVVYGPHGAGPVAARETREVHGERQTIIVLALTGGLSVELPLAHAHDQLRALADEAEIAQIGHVLGSEGTVSGETWLTRRRNANAKLKDAVGLAEIIRDGSARERAASRKSGSQLSPGERELVRRARGLLTHELALSRGVEEDEASAWIDQQLARPDDGV